jgi:hypothetical protein
MIGTVKDLIAEALFVSAIQPSQCPTRAEVDTAATEAILRYGIEGCAARVATEFGDHPDTAVVRMSWVRRTLGTLNAVPTAA